MHQSAEQGGISRPGPCIDRTRAWIGFVGIAILAALLVPDITGRLMQGFAFHTSGNDYVYILARQRRNQIVNFVIGAALHDGGGRVKWVVVPTDLQALSARPPDKMIGGVQTALQQRLLKQLVGGQLAPTDYDPVLAASTINAWKASGRLKTYPRHVYLLRPTSLPADGRWVLFTDRTRLKIYIVADNELPAGVTLP